MVSTPSAPIGRADLLSHARERLAAGGSVVLCGPAGIGKSTILDALAAAETEALVLRAAAAEAEADLPYLALVDLFDGAPDASDLLPAHLRAALDGALLRSALPATPHDQLAVRLAVLELFRALAADRPILLILDDVQWIDEPSAGVLRFVSRRLGEVPVKVLAAERVPDGGAPTRLDLCPPPSVTLPVPPLPQSDIADLLRARFGAEAGRAHVQRIFEASAGNPLYAVELGRAIGSSSFPVTDPLPVPDRLRELLAARLATLPADDWPALLVVASAARPSLALLGACGIAELHVEAGIAAGVLHVEPDGAIRFSHPLLREMVYADATAAARRETHERLADTVTDPVDRARHLAAARPEPDEGLAECLADAASAARLRGAPAMAADLAALAADRTPRATPGVAAVRRLSAAQYAYSAGSPADARRHAAAALRDAADRRTRVGARLLLVEMSGEDHSNSGPLLDAAFVEAVDTPDLLAHVRLYKAVKAYWDGDGEAALAELKRAEEAAELCGDMERLVEVLSWRGNILLGTEGDEYLERAGKLARGLSLTPATVAARQVAAMSRLFKGETAEAVRRIEALRIAVERAGTVRDLAAVLVSVAGIYWRAGRCADALVAGRDCVRLYVDVETTPGPGYLVAALVEYAGGSATAAAGYSDRGLAACLAAGDEDWIKLAYAISGLVHMLRGDPVAAAEAMREAYALDQRLGRLDPGVLPWHADFVEALVGAGARAEAAAVLDEVEQRARHLDRQVVFLGLARARAVLTAATGEAREGAEALHRAIEEWPDHPYPLELARAYYTLGGLERRAHRRGAARAALSEAVRRYGAADAHPWREVAAADLARLDGGRGAGLSETERRIVELVRAGATNREIARALFLSIKAVEANLTRLYRRLNVRNRSQLARFLDPE
ncbi:AAA family ATPase [Dactylosporangium vinaceum]|uniref:AAA family ATPase n=1 Tax=Dactylosporangium vinaceum TaxID=53362 RepID=A0ABV5M936_9ACTN|nr:LuxR family transcriptional regulator [Dactylosporangium vinaceum]UAB94614.1 AAA family ATPase [Dactylosporangium vinaceum]